jgi:hypothetical protein
MAKAKAYFGNSPISWDIEKLREQFGVPEPGKTIYYPDIEACIGISRKERRWYSIIGVWKRKLFRENNVLIEAERNIGYRSHEPHGRVDYASRQFKSGKMKIVRAAVVAATTDRSQLTPDAIRTVDHIQGVEAAFRLAELTASKSLSKHKAIAQRSKKTRGMAMHAAH